MVNKDFFAALADLEKEKGIPQEIFIEALRNALVSACKKQSAGTVGEVELKLVPEKGTIEFFTVRTVVEEVADRDLEISLEDARAIKKSYKLGDKVTEKFTPKDFSRIAAQTAKQVVVQRIREAERGVIYEQYIDKESEIMTGTVVRQERGCYYLDLGRVEGMLPMKETIPGERYDIGTRLKVYVIEVKDAAKGAQIVVSRSHPGLLKRLLELEVPEIASNTVIIKSIAREAGHRSKIAVYSEDPNVDCVGACVGPKGSRIERVVEELSGERIDVISWHGDTAEFIASALRPAKVIMARVIEEERAAQVIVPDYQLSLAIGKEGQNARLAAKLTGYKIDIKCQSQVAGDMFGEGEGLFDLPPVRGFLLWRRAGRGSRG